MSITLHRFNSVHDPISLITQAWMVISEYSEFAEETSGYQWNAAGDLPVLQYKHYVIQKQNILDFLRGLLDLDSDLSEEEKQTSKYIQSVCRFSLEPCIMHAQWTEDETSKEFYTARGRLIERVLTGPVNKLFFNLEKNRVSDLLRKEFNIELPQTALAKCKLTHEELSRVLGDKKFLFSKSDRTEHPRAADLIVYGYLKYQLLTLASHPQVAESLLKHRNLLELVARVESSLKLKVKAGVWKGNLCLYENGIKNDEEFFAPKVYESPLEYSSHEFLARIYRCSEDPPPLRRLEEDEGYKRLYISSIAFGLFLFFYLKT